MRSSLLLLANFLSVVCMTTARTVASNNLVVMESWQTTPHGWSRIGLANQNTRLNLKIALHMPDQALFEQTLLAVSSPDHPDYGKHLTREEVKELIKPRDSSTSTVLSWLKVAGVPSSDIDDRGDWINFSVVVAEAERLLGTKFYSFKQKNGKNSTQIIRTLQYSLPESIAPLVATIQPTTRFAQLRAQKTSLFEAEYMGKTTSDSSTAASTNKSSNPDATCSNEITPNCIRKLYNIGNYTANPRVGSLFGVCGYLEQYAKYVPLDIFLRTFARHAVGQNFTIQSINGGLVTQNDNEHDDIEANLDIQYAAALGYNQKIVYYSTGGRGKLVPDLDQPSPENNENEPYLEYLTYMLDLEDYELPQTITSSYGEDEQSIPKTYAKKICEMFGQLGLRGVSILVASGDTGPGSACQTNDGKNTTRLLPIFPASCPYVTSVGGTTGSEPEVAVGFSSGGFSDIFHRPSYQDNAVKHYLDYLGQEWKGLYNPHGRGFPDVAAQGRNFRIIDNATAGGYHEWLIGGTSASSPTFAGIVSLLNNARLAAGKKPLGFLNPWLYSHGKDGLNDITLGRSSGCTGIDMYSGLATPFIPGAGWNATKGWDPVSGLGTPDFRKLLELIATRR